MSLSIGLILLIAAVLPGIAALFAFYSGVSTTEVRIASPPLSSILSINLVGLFAMAAHLVYIACLQIVIAYSWAGGWPIADPYLLAMPARDAWPLAVLGSGLLGLAWVSVIGLALGKLAATVPWKARDEFLLGWLMPIVRNAEPEINYINAFVLTKIQNGKDVLGYEGVVENLALDADKNIKGIVLRDVESFYVRMDWHGSRRIPGITEIATLALVAEDFQNVALEVIRDEGLQAGE